MTGGRTSDLIRINARIAKIGEKSIIIAPVPRRMRRKGFKSGSVMSYISLISGLDGEWGIQERKALITIAHWRIIITISATLYIQKIVVIRITPLNKFTRIQTDNDKYTISKFYA